LFEDATILLKNGSFGAAQSLIVTAMEEAGKAIILELADLNYIGKEVVEQSMHEHTPKKVALLAMERGLLFVDNIDRRKGSCELQRAEMKKLQSDLRVDLENLENRRLNGFYVQVDANNGVPLSCPNRIQQRETEDFVAKAKLFLNLTEYLCKLFTEFRIHPERNNLRVFRDDLRNLYVSYDEV